jgi:glycine cleavage system H protein
MLEALSTVDTVCGRSVSPAESSGPHMTESFHPRSQYRLTIAVLSAHYVGVFSVWRAVMKFPKDRLYSDYHLWVKRETTYAVIGITEHAAKELGDVDYLELPAPNDDLTKNVPFGIIETSKAVTDLVAPLSGSVVEINVHAVESPGILTRDPYEAGWLLKVVPSREADLAELIKPSEYEKLVRAALEVDQPGP